MTLNRALSKQEIQGTLPRIQEFLIQRRHCIAWHTEHAAAQEASSLPLICCGLQGTCIVASGCLPISQPGATSPCHLVQSYKPEMLHGAFTLASRLHAVSFAKGCGAHARTWGVETNSSYRLLYSACISWVRSACVSGQTAGMEATPRRVLDCPGPGPFLTLDNTAAVQRTALADACGQLGTVSSEAPGLLPLPLPQPLPWLLPLPCPKARDQGVSTHVLVLENPRPLQHEVVLTC